MEMSLKILLPDGILLDQTVLKVTAEAENGSFCLLPRHVDFLAALVPGLLSFQDQASQERFVAIDAGILVKQGSQVLVSTRQAVQGDQIESLRETVQREFRTIDERERTARSAIARLESDLIRRFLELDEAPI
jgi:F-type H+-transporting ATPase subunit epsilon